MWLSGADQGPVSAARTSIFNDPVVGEEDDWHGDIANEGVWEELLAQGELAEDNPEGVRPEGWGGEAAEGTDTAHGNEGGLQEEEDNDPWKLLCPHEPGTLSIKPYQKGNQSAVLLVAVVATLVWYNCPLNSRLHQDLRFLFGCIWTSRAANMETKDTKEEIAK